MADLLSAAAGKLRRGALGNRASIIGSCLLQEVEHSRIQGMGDRRDFDTSGNSTFQNA
jgi:hypothetical protein